MTLPAIPVIDARGAAEPAVVSALVEPARLRLVLDAGDRTCTRLGVRLAEERSRVPSARPAGPYADAVRQVDRVVGRRGAYMLNHSHEWWCVDCVRPPILIPDTRLAMMASPHTGRMLLQGWEKGDRATAVLDLH